jgi:gamma-glutamyltranspeptidase/glutathione hydrolase
MTLRHVFFCLLAWMGTWASVCRGTPATATGGMVATVHPSGTDAGVEVLKRGGNAIDAAVAAALTLGVVNGQNSGIGGGCFILIRLADGEFVAIDGREMAPAAATRDMYLRDGKPQPEWSLTGPLASGVPGALAAYEHAIGRYGRLSLRELLLPAAETAEDGFALDASYADALGKAAKKLARFEGSRAALLKPDGSPYEKGDLLKLPDLARTYRAIADKGTGWFYRGPFARKVGEWMRANGGILSAEDFAGYRVCVRKPVVTT